MKEPTIFKSKVFKKLEEEFNKVPKVRIIPLSSTKEEKKKAKVMKEIMNYMFENNTNGITNKYMQVMKLSQDQFLAEELKGIRVNWEATERIIDQIVKEPKKFADMVKKGNK